MFGPCFGIDRQQERECVMEQEFSQASPSLATFKNDVWVAFLGKSSNEIYACSSSDGINWSTVDTHPVKQTSSSPPSLCQTTFNNKLWMAFRGATTNEVLVCSFDGTNWSTDRSIGQTTQAAPAIAVHDGKLWVAFIANNATLDILLCSSTDGKNWSPNVPVPGQSSALAPALAAYNDELWVAFIANNGSNNILAYSSSKADGNTTDWNAHPAGQSSSASPSLVTGSNGLWLGFEGNTTSDVRVCSWNGHQWSPNTAVPNQTTSTGPGITVFQSQLRMAFLSADVSNRLFTIGSVGSDASDWGPATQIGNYPGQITLNAGTPSNTISFGGGNALGLDPNQAQFYATLVLKSDGSCTYSGTYTNNGSLPVADGPPQTYSVAIVVLAGGTPFAFEHGGTAQNANHDSWNVSTTSRQVAAYWPWIATGTSSAHGTNQTSPGGILSGVWGALEDLVSDVVTIAKDVIVVLGFFSGSDGSGSASGTGDVSSGS